MVAPVERAYCLFHHGRWSTLSKQNFDNDCGLLLLFYDMMEELEPSTAFEAFETQLKTLCLKEFPCGIGRWKEDYSKKRNGFEKDNINSRFTVTLKEYGANYEKTECLEELVSSKFSPWKVDYSWSNEAKELREIAVRSPWLIDDRFVLSHFKTIHILDKEVIAVDECFNQFTHLEELFLTANRIETVKTTNLPPSLKVLELCANNISDLEDLCLRPPPLLKHLGLGYNNITAIHDYITDVYWPNLLSLDLSHNNLCDLVDIIFKLQTLLKLRNLILQGNPLTLVPGYRGFTIDSLRRLSFLDDISITVDEEHMYRGLARQKEHMPEEAKVVLQVSYIKGLPMPEEMENTEEVPEFPVVTRKYFVQFMFPECKVKTGENLKTDTSQNEITLTPSGYIGATSDGEPKDQAGAETEDNAKKPSLHHRSVAAPTQPNSDVLTQLPKVSVTMEHAHSVKEVPLAPINSASHVWAESIELNWLKTLSCPYLYAIRDFFKEGMQIAVLEEKVQSYPVDHFQDEDPSGMVSTMSKDGNKKIEKKLDKKESKAKDEKATKKDERGKDKHKDDDKGTKKKKDKNAADSPKDTKKKKDKNAVVNSKLPKDKVKKKGEPEIEMVALPSEYTTLCSFHIPLADFLEGDNLYENVYSHSGIVTHRSASPASVQSKGKGKKKSEASKDKKGDNQGKDKKKPGSPKKKDGKPEKDTRAKKDKKEDKLKDGKPDDDSGTPVPSPIEIHVRVKLVHWKTAMDSQLADETSEYMHDTA